MSKKRAHGGRRQGAGRKSSVSKADRLLIGARCQNEWDALSEAELLGSHRSRPSYEDIEESRKVLQKLPLEDRGVVLERAELKPLETDDLSVHIADAVIELRDIRLQLDGVRPDGSDYARKIAFKTSQDAREALIARVAVEQSEKCGIPISTKQVERWWDAYRAWCKQQHKT